MYHINNLWNNSNIKVLEKDENMGYSVIEFQKDLSITSPQEAVSMYYMAEMGAKLKTAVLELDGSREWTLSAGAMKVMLGDVKSKTNVKGVGDLFGKTMKASVSGETIIKPVYTGKGSVVLENTYRHIVPLDINEWGGKIVMNDSLYLASSGLDVSVERIKSLSGMALGGEGLFNTYVKGNKGVLLIESPKPREELVEVVLNNDVIKVDGNNAICWSSGLDFTVERTTKTLIGSAASGEGLVNVYRGTGKVLLYLN